ncbi:MAG: hypothetical protein AAFU67_02410 [Bacteroidota bacterium]
MKQLTQILFVSLLFSLSLSAQEKPLHFGLHISPNYIFASIIDEGGVDQSVVDLIRESNTGKIGFTTQLFVDYTFSEYSRIKLSGGYQSSGLRTTELTFTDENGNPLPDISTGSIIDNLHQLIYSLSWRQYLTRRFYFESGVSGIWLLSSNSILKTRRPNGSINIIEIVNGPVGTTFQPFTLAIDFAIGIDIIKRDDFSLFVQPQMQYQLHKAFNEGPVNRRLWSIGLTSGVRL